MSEELQKQLDAVLKKNDELEAKVTELIGEKRRASQKAKDLEKEKDDELRKAKEEKLKEEGKLEELHQMKMDEVLKDLEAARESLQLTQTELSTVNNDYRSLMVDDGLKAKFLSAGVTDEALLKACTSLHAGRAEVTDVDGKKVVTIDGKPVDDFMEEWKQGEGKSFISVKMSGGGSGGSSSGGAAEDVERYFDKQSPHYNASEQLKVKVENQELYNQLRDKFATFNPLVAR